MLEQEQVEAMAELVAKKLIDLGVIPPPSRTMRYELTQEQIERFKKFITNNENNFDKGLQGLAESFMEEELAEKVVIDTVLMLMESTSVYNNLAKQAMSSAAASTDKLELMIAKEQLAELEGKLNG